MHILVKFFIICGICFSGVLQAQKKYVVRYSDSVSAAVQLTTQFDNQAKAKEYIKSLQQYLVRKGFANAAIDSTVYNADTAIVTLYIGMQYPGLVLEVNSSELAALQRSGFIRGKTYNFQEVATIQQKLLDYYQENGYPFAAITLDSVVILQDNTVKARLQIEKSYLHKIDSIALRGKVKLNKKVLHNYLNIKPGSLYKKSLLDAIPRKINQLPYARLNGDLSLTMLPSASVININLAPKKSSIVNVLLGVIPAPNPNGLPGTQPSKVFLSGDVNILLNNALANGETMGLVYQQLSINSRRINLNYKQPFIFGSNYGVDMGFELYKRDSSYLNLETNLGITYGLGNDKWGKAFVLLQRTTTFPDTILVKATKKLPVNLDLSSINIGTEYHVNTTDYNRNPRSGWEWDSQLAFGTKKVKKNGNITALKEIGFDYTKLYDTVKLSTYQLRLKTSIAKYTSLGKQWVLKAGVKGGILLSQNYFRNELYQIGGFKLLRGFDEESQFCNVYSIGTVEARFLLGGDSYFLLFSDGGYTRNEILQANNTYISGGMGLNFATKSGTFNLSFAVGTRNDIPFGFKQSKFHFGYVSFF